MAFGVANIFRIPELRKKIFVTLGILLVYRLGFHVPIPGVNVEALQRLSESQGALGQLFGLMGSLTGGRLSSAALFSLGVMPYISASIIFSLLAKTVPSLEKLQKEGQAGQRKINQYTRLATIPICLVQSFFVIFGVLNQTVEGGLPLVYKEVWGLPYILGVMIALTAGTMFIMWLGEQITEHGIGNGMSIIIMAGIIAGMPQAVMAYFTQQGTSADERLQRMLLYALAWILVVFCIVYITKGQRRIPIQQARQTRGRKVYGGQRHFLPIKVNQAGVMPIIFAQALMILPMSLSYIPGIKRYAEPFSNPTSFSYIVIYSIIIVFFAFFWVQMMFQPKEIADNLREQGSFVPGIRPGQKTAEFIQFVMTRVTLAGAIFLCLIAIMPNFITQQIGGLNQTWTYFLGGTSILIVVEVALDLVEQINAHVVMKNYEGFMKSGGTADSPTGWGRKPSS
ncbi:MAG: preprotein translocase subunit SecY [Planctomycetes bacterium]|nr:preprotein translocase subunit SecY [Planctomycetota bacterium]